MFSSSNTTGANSNGSGNCDTSSSDTTATDTTSSGGSYDNPATPAGQNAQKVITTLEQYGVSGAGIAGIMSNILAEGGFSLPDQAEYGANAYGSEGPQPQFIGHVKGGQSIYGGQVPAINNAAELHDGGGGGGPFQITPYSVYAPIKDPKWLDMGQQTIFMLQHKTQHVYQSTVLSQVINAPDTPTGAYNAAAIWQEKVEIGGSVSSHAAHAQDIYNDTKLNLSSVKADTSKQTQIFGSSTPAASNSSTTGTDTSNSTGTTTCPPAAPAPTGAGIQAAIQWAVSVANNQLYGYGQYNPSNRSCFTNSSDTAITTTKPCAFDCGSFVTAALRIGGGFSKVYISEPSGDEIPDLEAAGFKDVTSSVSTRSNNKVVVQPNKLQPGDVLVKSGKGDHTELYIGNGQNVGAHCGSPGCVADDHNPGDQEDAASSKPPWNQEVGVTPYYDDGWTTVLRYSGN